MWSVKYQSIVPDWGVPLRNGDAAEPDVFVGVGEELELGGVDGVAIRGLFVVRAEVARGDPERDGGGDDGRSGGGFADTVEPGLAVVEVEVDPGDGLVLQAEDARGDFHPRPLPVRRDRAVGDVAGGGIAPQRVVHGAVGGNPLGDDPARAHAFVRHRVEHHRVARLNR